MCVGERAGERRQAKHKSVKKVWKGGIQGDGVAKGGKNSKRQSGRNGRQKEECEGKGRYIPGYTSTLEDLRLWEVYRKWFHTNDGVHLSRGITDDATWNTWWRDLAVMPSSQYDTLEGGLLWHFVRSLSNEIRGVQACRWNAENFIIFQTVNLKHALHVTAYHVLRWWIGKRLDAWEDGKHQTLVK